jgi:hypothetical protein
MKNFFSFLVLLLCMALYMPAMSAGSSMKVTPGYSGTVFRCQAPINLVTNDAVVLNNLSAIESQRWQSSVINYSIRTKKYLAKNLLFMHDDVGWRSQHLIYTTTKYDNTPYRNFLRFGKQFSI